jgi:hypothetical protein
MNDDDLPPLPEPQVQCSVSGFFFGQYFFSADQMRAYARAALAAQAEPGNTPYDEGPFTIAQPTQAEPFYEAACRAQCDICPGTHRGDNWPCAKAAAGAAQPTQAEPVALTDGQIEAICDEFYVDREAWKPFARAVLAAAGGAKT